MMSSQSLATFYVSLGYIGLLPAPGTCASIFIFLLWHLFPFMHQGIMALFIALSGWCALHFIPHACYDPGWIVIDEGAGMLISLYGLATYPSGWTLLALVIFRFIDISKVGIGWIDKQKTITAVMLDDIGAGIVTNCIVRALYVFFA